MSHGSNECCRGFFLILGFFFPLIGAIESLAISLDCKQVVTAAADGCFTLWEVEQ